MRIERVGDEPALAYSFEYLPRDLSMEFEPDEQAGTPNLANHGVAHGKVPQPFAEIQPDCGHMFDDIESLYLLQDGEGDGAGQRVAAECRGMVAGLENSAMLLGQGRADRETAPKSLRERHHIRLDIPLRVRPECAATTDPGLHLVEDQEQIA